MNGPWSRVAIGDAWVVAARARGLARQWVRLPSLWVARAAAERVRVSFSAVS